MSSKFKLKNFIILTLAGIVNAIGVTLFLAPVNLYDSGVSGTSILLSQVTPEWLNLPVFLIVLNVPLFVYGWKRQGADFSVYSIYAVLVYAGVSFLITDVLPVDVSFASPLAGTDLLLCALFGGLISGAGSGLAIKGGGAIDGMDVLAVIFAKRLGMSVGSFVMMYNVLLYIICGAVRNSWILPLYSIVAYMAALKTVDFLVEGLNRSKGALIVTANYREVCKTLSEELKTGLTVMEARGYYSDTSKSLVYVVVNRFQITQMTDMVHEIDPMAYISVFDIADVSKGIQAQG